MSDSSRPIKDPWQEAADFGIDIQLIRDNLKLSYEERAKQHQQALAMILALKAAKKNYEDSQHSHSNTAKS